MIPIIPMAGIMAVNASTIATSAATIAIPPRSGRYNRDDDDVPPQDNSVDPEPARKYSYSDIQALRAVCERIWLYGDQPSLGMCGFSRSYKESEKDHGVEQLVRTNMMAGITAEDIYASQRKRAAVMRKAMFPEQMKMARRFCEHHAGKISKKGVWQVYRGYRSCHYGRSGTPSINSERMEFGSYKMEVGDINGGHSGCPDYVLYDAVEESPEPQAPAYEPPAIRVRTTEYIEPAPDDNAQWLGLGLILFVAAAIFFAVVI